MYFFPMISSVFKCDIGLQDGNDGTSVCGQYYVGAPLEKSDKYRIDTLVLADVHTIYITQIGNDRDNVIEIGEQKG